MKRLKAHRDNLNRIAKLDVGRVHRDSMKRAIRMEPGQITGQRKLFAEIIALWLDTETDEERCFIEDIAKGVYGNDPKHPKMTDPEDIPIPENQSHQNKQTAADLRSGFALLLEEAGKRDAAVSSTEGRSS